MNSILPFDAQKWDLNSKEGAKIRKSLTVRAKTALSVAILLIVLILTVVLMCVFGNSADRIWMPSYESKSRLGIYSQAAVSTDAAPCAPIGRDILRKNGTAIDAAIAVLFCMGAVNPQSMGLGGGFLMMFYNRTTEQTVFIDARESAPMNAAENMFEGNTTLSTVGGLSIAVPGELAGYISAYEKFGSLPWPELLEPTISLCRRGVPVGPHLAKALRQSAEIIEAKEAMRKVFVNNATGKVYVEGELIHRPDLANTLEIISKDKLQALYGPHELATKFLKDLKDMGSIIEETDLKTYKPRIIPSVAVQLRNNITLHSVGPPGSGALLAFMLLVLDGYNMSKEVSRYKAETVLALHRIIETFKFAYARRMEMEDDLEAMKPLIHNLTSPYFASEIRAQIDDGRTFSDPAHYGLNPGSFAQDHGTAHMSVVSPSGDAVAVTSTINLYFGSLEISPSTGIILNNEMDDFSSPGLLSYFEVPPSTKNQIKPGRKPMSSMCPAIAVDDQGDVRLVVGGNGGTKITTGVLQVILRNLWLDEDMKSSIDAPRFHHQLIPNRIDYEKGFPEDLLEGLNKLGHESEELENQMVGIIMGIARGKDGLLYANADYRKGGEVEGF